MRKANMVMMTALAVALVMTLTVPLMADDMVKVNINTATVDQLVTLDRIGEKYAERIVAYREAHGLFKTPEDIMNVPGIGEKTFAANMDRIVVSASKKE